jgi:ComF family protein
MPEPIAPPFCRQCGYPYPALEAPATPFTCAFCASRKWYFQWARAAYPTSGQLLEAVIGFKYSERFYERRRLTGWLVEAFDRHAAGESWDGLVPVPLYHRRHRDRGFNQAKELARGLGKQRGIPILNALYRYRETVSQTKLDRSARWDNMADAFQLKRGFDVKGLRLLVIDDVFTTGATANACAHVLAQAGARSLAVLTVARS